MPRIGKAAYDFSGASTLSHSLQALDRFKPALGYVKGNIYIISFRANRIKGNATLEEIQKVIKYVEEGNGKQHQYGTAPDPED